MKGDNEINIHEYDGYSTTCCVKTNIYVLQVPQIVVVVYGRVFSHCSLQKIIEGKLGNQLNDLSIWEQLLPVNFD